MKQRSGLARFAVAAIAVTAMGSPLTTPAAFAQGARAKAKVKAKAPPAPGPIGLADGWELQSSAQVKQGGEAITRLDYEAKDWYRVAVPTTVVAALVAHKVLPDPYVGTNIRHYPGMGYAIGKNFSKYPMPAESPFAVPWWYRKQFAIPATWKGQSVWLHFAGINYRANIWVNGKLVAKESAIAGSMRTYDLDITDQAHVGEENVVAVEIRAPRETDLGITFVDWNPAPPDKSMGLWREVVLVPTGPVAVRNPSIITELDSPKNSRARVTVMVLLENATAHDVTAQLRGKLGDATFEDQLTLSPKERRDVTLDPERFPELELRNPKLWWPAQMGTPNLYDLDVKVLVDGKPSDEATVKVGLRQVKATLDEHQSRLFSINGKNILIRGAGWSSDMLLNYDRRRVEDQLAYVRHMGLNTVRLEGKLEPDHFFEQTDRMGLMVIAGWCCCDHWERWDKWKAEDHAIADQSLRAQIYRLREHASVVAWMNGSDNPPAPEVEKDYLRVESELGWPGAVISSAAAKPTPVSGPSGVKMSGPYEWVPPSYWMTDDSHGGAHGFNSETSPGPAPPPIESLRRMFPPDKLWPQNEVWDFHAGGDVFTNIKKFTRALEGRYGRAETVEDFAMKSQLMAYEGIRAMFEAYSRNKYRATGVIQWMLNNAWPGLIWHLYDYYLRPGGGYFGAKIALEPVHPIYSYDDGSVWVVNSKYEPLKALKVTAQILELDGTPTLTRTASLELPPDGTAKALDLPPPTGKGSAYFVKLKLEDGRGHVIGSNFYWLSVKKDELEWSKSDWYFTPTTAYADLTEVTKLPKTALKQTVRTEHKGAEEVTTVSLENPSKQLAFFVRLKLLKGAGGDEVLPVRWDDNYVSLAPGEKRDISATYRASDLEGKAAVVKIEGPNLQPSP